MKGFWKYLRLALAAALPACTAMGAVEAGDTRTPAGDGAARVVVIPIHEEIDKPALYILRRGIKEAIQQGADTVVLDMDTPGGDGSVMLEIIDVLRRFPGRTITYVDKNAMSAGAIIAAATDDIYFSEDGVMGAAAPIKADGSDIDSTLKGKIVSALNARIRSLAGGKGYRAQVLAAMIDSDSELKIGGETIKAKGDKVLTLTAGEAVKTYGDPPQPLLGAGISPGLDDLLEKLHKGRPYDVSRVEITWSERLAKFITALAPVLMALGMLALFIEFKTPGFGVFGITGGVLLAIVFFGHYSAGLSGHEPAILFVLGVILVVAEVFVFPGTALLAASGLVLMLGSLVWAMADLWPNEPVVVSGDVFLMPLVKVLGGLGIAVVGFAVLLRFLPKGGPWNRMVLNAAVGGEPVGGMPLAGAAEISGREMLGREVVAATPLYPSGQVSYGGRCYEARMGMGFAEAGARLKVTAVGEFGLTVEPLSA